jgi:hypothetical protein
VAGLVHICLAHVSFGLEDENLDLEGGISSRTFQTRFDMKC